MVNKSVNFCAERGSQSHEISINKFLKFAELCLLFLYISSTLS